ncbi:DUF6292 family protein [Streptomyces sp. NPDC054775]
MIRAGRRKFVQTRDELAAEAGMKPGTFAKHQPYSADDFPDPISSKDARVLLWDSEQTAAHYAGMPIPVLPEEDHDQDLLDRSEAAELLGVSPKTWDDYKKHEQIAPHLVKVKGVEHCPRRVITAFRAAKQAGPGRRGNKGRPQGSGDTVPRDQILLRVAELLDVDPAVTSATVIEVLGLSYVTATRALSRLRGERIADLLTAQPDMTPERAAEQLGYPTAVHRVAIGYASTELRARGVQPYLQHIADALVGAGLAPLQDVVVQHLAGDVLGAALLLHESAPAPALVWDERYGWRTATNRRHPMGKDTGTAPEGEGIRYLSAEHQPDPADLLAALTDGRRGFKHPRTEYAADGSLHG